MADRQIAFKPVVKVVNRTAQGFEQFIVEPEKEREIVDGAEACEITRGLFVPVIKNG